MTTNNASFEVGLDLDTSDFRREMANANRLADGFARSLTSAFVGVAVKGRGLSDVIGSIGLRLSQAALNAAFKPLEQGLGALIQPLTQGVFGAASQTLPQITPFAKGGVIAQPAFFPMNGGLGLTGERGAEAILPLARDSSGRLGVQAGGAATSAITINISTPDVDGFRRSQTEIAAALARSVARGQRGL